MASSTPSGFVIRKSDPRRRRAIAGGLVVLLAVAALAGFLAGHYHGAEERDSAERHRELMTELQKAYAANAELRNRVAALERSEQVARNANAELKTLIGSLQEKLAAVRGDLSLYQGLAAAGGNQPGLGVHRLVVSPTMAPRVYEFTLMLTQNLKQANMTSGKARIYLEGSRKGRPARLGLEQLQADSDGSLSFSFKYFQMLEGSLTLPEDFQPGRIVVRLDPEGKGKTETSQADFDWSAVVKQPRQRAKSGATGP